MNNTPNQNQVTLEEALNQLRVISFLRIGAALETPEGIRYRNYVTRVQNYAKGDKQILAQIEDALNTLLLVKGGTDSTPEKESTANQLLNTILGRSAQMELNDDELAGIAGAVQVLDIK